MRICFSLRYLWHQKRFPRLIKRLKLKIFASCSWFEWASICLSILRGKKVLVKLLFPQNGPEKNFQISAPPGPGKMSTFFPFKIERQIEAHSNQEHEAKILSLSLFIKRGNRFWCHRYLKKILLKCPNFKFYRHQTPKI